MARLFGSKTLLYCQPPSGPLPEVQWKKYSIPFWASIAVVASIYIDDVEVATGSACQLIIFGSGTVVSTPLSHVYVNSIKSSAAISVSFVRSARLQ